MHKTVYHLYLVHLSLLPLLCQLLQYKIQDLPVVPGVISRPCMLGLKAGMKQICFVSLMNSLIQTCMGPRCVQIVKFRIMNFYYKCMSLYLVEVRITDSLKLFMPS